MENVANVQLGL